MKRLLAIIAFCLFAGFIDSEPLILLTVFDPDRGGINCGGSSCANVADGHLWAEADYERLAACPSFMVYRGANRITIDVAGMTLQCRDTGGLVNLAWNETYQRYVIHIDVMADLGDAEQPEYPWYNYTAYELEDVNIYWSPVGSN